MSGAPGTGNPPTPPPRIARRGTIPPFIVMDVMRAANDREAEGAAVLHLEVGQPSTAAPSKVREAAHAALTADLLGYTDALGLERLRRRIARHYGETYGVAIDWRRVVVTTGSSGAFVLAFLAAFDIGDRVVVTVPGYPAYRNILSALGTDVVLLPVGPDSHFQPTPALLDGLGSRLDGLIVASPANPTGSMLAREHLRDLVGYCRDRGIRLVSDEIYHGITFTGPASTALAFDDQTIVVNSFSKYYSMTGWRMGWMVVPEPLGRSVECLAQNLFISPPTLSQHAAIEAFACREELDANVARYAVNRATLLEMLPKAGFARLAPADGAFYLYADVRDQGLDSESLCRRMLIETGVAATPGIDFDPLHGRGYVRFSFAGSEGDIRTAAARLIAWRR
jgi:aspartate/methionine/tyrosine aminotransferase